MTIHLKTPDLKELRPKIAVVGVGGAGGNAINNMISAGLEGVSFIAANTDAQALLGSKADVRLQLGASMTEGLGAGSRPEVGARAAEESIEEIRSHLRGLHMVFITAGMGGGTGTGAAPVIAAAARAEGVLTVGVVTKPFHFEGQRRMKSAEFGIELLAEQVDTLIVIPNQNLFRVAQVKTTFSEAFAMADQVLHDGISCITDVMVKEGIINLDFADVNLIMRGSGKAMMGTGEARGENRGREAAEAAISNPLLDDVTLHGAGGLLVSIIGGKNDLTLYEVDEAANRVREEVRSDANIIVGTAFDDSLDGVIRVSVVATGLQESVNIAPAPQELIAGETAAGAQEAERASLAAASHAASHVVASHAAAPTSASGAPSLAARLESAANIDDVAAVMNGAGGRPVAGEATLKPASAPLPAPISPSAPRVRMPAAEDFSQPGQALLQSRGQSEEQGLASLKRRVGFFERLAGFAAPARTNSEQEAPVAREPHQSGQLMAGDELKTSPYIDPHQKGGALSASAQGVASAMPSPAELSDFPSFLRKSG
jgi:cell division protein FtsZ